MSGIATRHSRVTSSTPFGTRKRRPQGGRTLIAEGEEIPWQVRRAMSRDFKRQVAEGQITAGCNPQPLHCPQDAARAAQGLGLSKERVTPAIRTFAPQGLVEGIDHPLGPEGTKNHRLSHCSTGLLR